MADSRITKKALAASLKALMNEKPFEKIGISEICARCGMNRKSFYYHFRDKYDLVNWIFDTDMKQLMKSFNGDSWHSIRLVCTHLYDNKAFYRKALCITGQNSFSDHFQEFIAGLLSERITHVLGKVEINPMAVTFVTDGTFGAVKRWLLETEPVPADVFVQQLHELISRIQIYILHDPDFSRP